MTASKKGFAPKTVKVDSETDSVDLVLGRGGRVEGRVCGTAWERPSIAVEYGPGGEYSSRNQVLPETTGRFVLENAEPGPFTFVRSWHFRDPARPGATFDWSGWVRASVEVREGETSRLSLGCDGIPLSGVVRRGGRPVASEIVAFSLGGRRRRTPSSTRRGAFSPASLRPASGSSRRAAARRRRLRPARCRRAASRGAGWSW